MNKTELEIRDKIVAMLRERYKRTKVNYAVLSDDYLMMLLENCAWHRYPWVAKRVLDAFPEIRVVHFFGGWTELVYTRETLKWAGYNMKEHKTEEAC